MSLDIQHSSIESVFQDAIRFRLWIQLAAEKPSVVAKALANCITEEQYREALDALMPNVVHLADDIVEKLPEQQGYIVNVEGNLRAWFADAEEATTWAMENYYGRWLLSQYSLILKPLFTQEQIDIANAKAAEFMQKFKIGNVENDDNSEGC